MEWIVQIEMNVNFKEFLQEIGKFQVIFYNSPKSLVFMSINSN